LNAIAALDQSASTPVNAAPANIAAEQALLGAVLYENQAYERVPDRLRAEHFHEPFHGRLWAAMVELIGKGKLAEPVTLHSRFEADGAYQELGGVSYLADLVDKAPPGFNAAEYAEQVYDLALRRALLEIGQAVAAGVNDGATPASEQIAAAEEALYTLAEQGESGQGFREFSEVVAASIGIAAEAYSRDGGLSGLSTGLIDLDQLIGGLHPSDLVILAGRPSMGKAQPLDARVLMRDGSWKAMGALRLGDELASVDGAASRVAGIFPKGRREVFKVTLSDGRSTRACAEHLWAIDSCKLSGRKVVQTDCLAKMLEKERFQRRVSLPLASGHFGSDDGLLIDPWLLGALIGNGGMTGGTLKFSTADAATLYRVQKAVGAECVVSAGGDYDYRLNQSVANGLTGALQHYGLWGKGSPEKFIPAAYKSASRESRMELLRGLLDTDGWVETFGAVRYATSSRQLADDIVELVRSVGGVCAVSIKKPTFTHKGEKRDGLDSYVLNMSHPDRASLLSLKRKQRRCEAEMRFRAPTVVSIASDGEEPTQCIRVTHPSSLYITDDYIVTHNSALAANIAFHVAKSGDPAAFYSLEMSAEQLGLRILADVAGVSGDRIRKGEINASEFGRLRDAAAEIERAPLHIDATGGLSLGKLAARARRLKRRRGLSLIVVDYLQLLTAGRQNSSDGRVQEVSAITMGLKALAKELNVPVIALSQLSRQVETRNDKRPMLSDLRESGSIEQDADMVWFVYREEYYLSRSEPREGTAEHLTWCDDMSKVQGLAEVIIGKQRHGPIGTVKLAFNSDLTKFGNLAREGRFEGRALDFSEPRGGR
jgi:replicative DNA helicase